MLTKKPQWDVEDEGSEKNNQADGRQLDGIVESETGHVYQPESNFDTGLNQDETDEAIAEGAQGLPQMASAQISHQPGRQLKVARVAVGMSIKEVAERLRLPEQTIADMENDDFSQGPALIYVRGYLRAYSRVVDLPASPILKAFDAMGWEERKESDLPDLSHAMGRERQKKMQWGWFSLFAAVVFLLVGVVLWSWLGKL